MKVLIMSDMEGVSGIVTWNWVNGGADAFNEGRKLYTEEINAAVRGARQAGASEIVVVDCHGAGGDWSFNSLVPELLDPGCEWVAHHPWSRFSPAGFDACLLVAMHAKANTPDGIMCHTVSSTSWRGLWFNDVSVGEVGINAALCGVHGVPVLLVTGDVATCRESTDLLGPGLTTVAVKEGLSRYSARQIPPVRARQMIEAGATASLKDLAAVKPYTFDGPVTIRFELASVDHAAKHRGRPGVTIVDDLVVTSVAPTWQEAWDQFWPWGS